jgi:hypothetical protein
VRQRARGGHVPPAAEGVREARRTEGGGKGQRRGREDDGGGWWRQRRRKVAADGEKWQRRISS